MAVFVPEPSPQHEAQNAELPEESWVLRGGTMRSDDLQRNAEDHHDEFPGQWAISVWSAAGMTIEELAGASQIRNGRVRVATVAQVRALGHDVVPDENPDEFPHANLMLNDEPSEDLWNELREGAFALSRPNPSRYEGT